MTNHERELLARCKRVPTMKNPRIARGGRLGKRAQKAYSGTMKAAPADATIGARVMRPSTVRVIESTPREFDRIAERGMEIPR